MAREMGLGITPWSPLKGGALSGKYRRSNAGKVDSARGEWITRSLNDRSYEIIETLCAVAQKHGCTPAEAALAWLRAMPGVTSTIIGARTVEQLDQNLGSLRVTLDEHAMRQLDEVSRPKLNFPHDFLGFVVKTMQNGAMVNGREGPAWELSPQNDSERW
jgi:aryl-alcohol dehydrogenase-like predicted oxidoreductase